MRKNDMMCFLVLVSFGAKKYFNSREKIKLKNAHYLIGADFVNKLDADTGTGQQKIEAKEAKTRKINKKIFLQRLVRATWGKMKMRETDKEYGYEEMTKIEFWIKL